jgi:hypothetical protein
MLRMLRMRRRMGVDGMRMLRRIVVVGMGIGVLRLRMLEVLVRR